MTDVNEQSPQMPETTEANQTSQTTETLDEAEHLYLQGMRHLRGIGEQQNISAAADCFLEAVKLNNHAKSAYQLGRINAAESKYDNAQIMLSKAAKQGHVFAIYELCKLHCAGEIKANNDQVIEWLKALAEHNIKEAQYQLGNMYFSYSGDGRVTHSYKEASKWFEKAANQGHKEAQFQIGEMYYVGLGVTQSYAKAFHYYTEAANQGCSEAKCRLGMMYCEGEGTALNLGRAEQCYNSVLPIGELKAWADQQSECINELLDGTIVRELLQK